ncbi:MAG: 30S ribosome-binding factor RbfA [Streptococcaceae bacterium]|jgi:ribosome-binding factor A|nr:30S ribosome-binding factor RbfA [Streptococcaceae bacterium]
MAQFRDRKLATELSREINDILTRRVRDPRVNGVTVTDIRVTGDLSQATVYYSILSDLASDAKKAQEGLKKATGLIKRELGARLVLYKIPDIHFERDTSVQYGSKIDEMIKKLHQEKH